MAGTGPFEDLTLPAEPASYKLYKVPGWATHAVIDLRGASDCYAFVGKGISRGERIWQNHGLSSTPPVRKVKLPEGCELVLHPRAAAVRFSSTDLIDRSDFDALVPASDLGPGIATEAVPVAVAAAALSAAIDVTGWKRIEVYLTTAAVVGFNFETYWGPKRSGGGEVYYFDELNSPAKAILTTATQTLWIHTMTLNGSPGYIKLRPSINASIYVAGVSK